MRRRDLTPRPPTDEPPQHFCYADWRTPDEPEHPVFMDANWMRALRRYMDARLAWYLEQQGRQWHPQSHPQEVAP